MDNQNSFSLPGNSIEQPEIITTTYFFVISFKAVDVYGDDRPASTITDYDDTTIVPEFYYIYVPIIRIKSQI